jgi:hypothetical protein
MMGIFDALEGLVSGKINILKTVMVIMKLEARLAGLSIFPLLMNLCMLFGVLITVWLSTMVLMGYFLMLALNNMMYTLLIIWIINLCLLIGLIKYLRFNLKNMSFEKTRDFFSKNEGDFHEKLENKSN